MASSDLPAMEIDPVGFGLRNNILQAQSQLEQLNLQKAKASTPLEMEAQQMDFDAKKTLLPLEVKAKQDAAKLEEMQTGNAIIAQVVRDAQAADGPDKAKVWDEGMQKAADAGYSVARQYVGHYRDGLADNLADAYGGGNSTRAKAAEERAAVSDNTAIQRAVAQVPIPQLTKSLANLERALDAWDKIAVGGKSAWDEEMANLKAAGIDPSLHLASLDYNPMNYAAAAKLIKGLMPYRDAAAERVAVASTGMKPAEPKQEGTSTYIGTQPGSQKPVYHNTTTGEDTIGQFQVGPKPTAGFSLFQYKQKAAEDAGMSTADALQFANGRKQIPDVTLRHWAEQGANSELADVTLAGSTIANPQEWVRQRKDEIYRTLKTSGGAPGGGGSMVPKPAPVAQIPQRAVDQLKKANGKALRFPNQQVWKWQNGKPVRVQ